MSDVIPIRAQKQLVPGRDRYADIAGYAYCIQDTDGDTKVCAGRDGDNTVHVDLGGVTPITDVLTMNQTNGLVWNSGNNDIDLAVHGDTDNNLIYFNAGLNAVGFNTDTPSWIRAGTTRYSKFLAVKPDTVNWNAGSYFGYFNDPLRTTDVASGRARGTEASPLAVQDGDGIVNWVFEGHDGTDFEQGAGIKVEVDSTVSAGDVPMSMKLQTSSGGVTSANLTMRSSGYNGFGTTSPNSVLHVAGSMAWNVTNINTNSYTTVDDDCIIGANTASYTPTIYLGSDSRAQGRIVVINDRSGNAATNNITIDGNGKTIDGASTITISANYGNVILYYGGSNFFTLAS